MLFSGRYKYIIEQQFKVGVYLGLDSWFKSGRNKIKSFEFPFYPITNKIKDICADNSVECHFTSDDCLKQTHPNLMTATTNCGNPHAVAGNNVGFGSDDDLIGQNVGSHCNKFSALINTEMRELYVSTDLKVKDESDEEMVDIRAQSG